MRELFFAIFLTIQTRLKCISNTRCIYTQEPKRLPCYNIMSVAFFFSIFVQFFKVDKTCSKYIVLVHLGENALLWCFSSDLQVASVNLIYTIAICRTAPLSFICISFLNLSVVYLVPPIRFSGARHRQYLHHNFVHPLFLATIVPEVFKLRLLIWLHF